MKPKERPDRYFQLHHYMLKTDTWLALPAQARAVYVQIGLRYNGENNGRIAFSVRDAAKECNLNKNTAARVFKALIDFGFIEETRHGGLNRKSRMASEWRLTAFRCDLTGASKTCLFRQRGEVARGYRLARCRPQTGLRLSQTRPASVLKEGTACPKRGSRNRPSVPNEGTDEAVLGGSPVPNEGTHIIYQVGSRSKGQPADALSPPPSTAADPRRRPSRLATLRVNGATACLSASGRRRRKHPSEIP